MKKHQATAFENDNSFCLNVFGKNDATGMKIPFITFLFYIDPGDSRPVLLIGGPDRIVITQLNGTGHQPLRSLSVNGTLALDFQHSQESVCWALSTQSSGQLRCAVTRNLRGFTREQEIRTQQSLQRMFITLSFPVLTF